jgi:hypothetical protein
MIVNFGILTSLCITVFPALSKKHFTASLKSIDREQLFDSFASIARVSLLILYFFAVLSKLNWDYLQPDISCANWWLNVIRNNGFTFIPTSQSFIILSIYGSLIIEIAIPLLLWFRKTRFYGILLGLGFHFSLSLDPHTGMFSFVILLYCLYFLFTPREFPDKLFKAWNDIVNGKQKVLKVVVPIALIGLLIVIGIITTVRLDHPLKYPVFLVWYLTGMFLIVTYLTVMLSQNFDNPVTDEYLRIQKGIYWVIPSILIFNGLTPYLGLKTELAMAMYSNLRTEGGKTNHLFIPTSFHIVEAQEDLIDIIDTNLEGLKRYQKQNQLITFFEFRRMASNTRKKDFYAKYARKGKIYTLQVKNGISNIPEVTAKVPYLLNKFYRFRPIHKGPNICLH